MDELRQIAGAGGSGLYVGAGTYKTSDGTLKAGTRVIRVRADQAAMITSIKLLIKGSEVAQTGAINFVGADLLKDDEIFYPHPISEIVIAGGSFIGYRG